MKKLIYLFSLALLVSCKSNTTSSLGQEIIDERYTNGIIIEKRDSWSDGKILVIKINDVVEEVPTYDLYFGKYNLGDTIK